MIAKGIETAPKDGTRILVWLEGLWQVARWQDGWNGKRPEGWRASFCVYGGENAPKFWCSLPAEIKD